MALEGLEPVWLGPTVATLRSTLPKQLLHMEAAMEAILQPSVAPRADLAEEDGMTGLTIPAQAECPEKGMVVVEVIEEAMVPEVEVAVPVDVAGTLHGLITLEPVASVSPPTLAACLISGTEVVVAAV